AAPPRARPSFPTRRSSDLPRRLFPHVVRQAPVQAPRSAPGPGEGPLPLRPPGRQPWSCAGDVRLSSQDKTLVLRLGHAPDPPGPAGPGPRDRIHSFLAIASAPSRILRGGADVFFANMRRSPQVSPLQGRQAEPHGGGDLFPLRLVLRGVVPGPQLPQEKPPEAVLPRPVPD